MIDMPSVNNSYKKSADMYLCGYRAVAEGWLDVDVLLLGG